MSSRRPPALGVGRDAKTRDRLLRAAALTFSERGFDEATVREVCRRAGANVASVNYHFGSKERLYVETLRWAVALCQSADTASLAAIARRGDLSDRERLREVLLALARGWLAARPEWYTRLALREMSAPSGATDAIVKEFVEPRYAVLKSAIAPFLPHADDRSLSLHAMSVVGQLLYHRVASPVALRLLGERAYSAVLVERIAAHVAEFTLRALGAEPDGDAA
jgi:AcrR family transcriptional regulator